MAKKTYKVEGFECVSCATMLELDFEDAGLTCKCDFAKRTITVDEETDVKKVLSVISESGYKIIE